MEIEKMVWFLLGLLILWIIVAFFRIAARAIAKEKEREATQGFVAQRNTPPRVSITFGNYGNDDDGEEEKETIQKGNSIIGIYDDYVVVDVETTGGSPKKDAMIEVAAVRIECSEVTKKYTTLINPERAISGRITKINGISEEMVLSAPNIDKVIPQLLEFMGDGIVVAHNANFDINFISSAVHDVTGEWFNNDFVDTLKLSRALFSEHKTHKLEDIIKRFGIDDHVEHRALSDAIQVNKVYEHIKDHIKNNGIDVSKIGTKKWSADRVTGTTLDVSGDLTADEREILDYLVEKCGNIDIRIKTDKLSNGVITIGYWLNNEKYGMQLGKIKLGSKSKWMSGYGIGNDSPTQRLNGEITDFKKKIDDWVEAIKRHYTTGIDIYKQIRSINQEEDLTK